MEFQAADRTWAIKFMSEGERDGWIRQLEETAADPDCGNLLHADYALKQGYPIPKWKTKYCKFYANLVMKFFDAEGNSMMSGITVLKGTDVEMIKRDNLNELDWPFEFHVHTSGRVWKFRTRTITQQNKWISTMTRAFDDFAKIESLQDSDGKFMIVSGGGEKEEEVEGN